MQRLLAALLGCLMFAACSAEAPEILIDAFLDTLTADWVRMNPNQAIATRYFTGAEQDALETQITPLTREWRRQRVELARRGLKEPSAFDPERLTDAQRVSTGLMKWQLELIVEGEHYYEYAFPLEQFAGARMSTCRMP